MTRKTTILRTATLFTSQRLIRKTDLACVPSKWVQNFAAYVVHSEWKQRCSRLYKESICYCKLLTFFITEGSFKKQHNMWK